MDFLRRDSRPFLLLLGIDLIFMVLHVINSLTPLWNNPLLNIEKDGGYAEFFQYLKYFGAAVFLMAICLRLRALPYLAWSMLFVYLLADDALGFHEQFGGLIASHLDGEQPFGLRPQDIGELLFALITALLVLLPLALAFWKGTTLFRQSAVHLFQLMALLAACGVLADLLHMTVQSGWKLKFLLALIEDGGEMFTASALLAYSHLLLQGLGTPPRHAPWCWLWSIKSNGTFFRVC